MDAGCVLSNVTGPNVFVSAAVPNNLAGSSLSKNKGVLSGVLNGSPVSGPWKS